MKNPFTLHPSFYFALGIVIMKSVSLLMLPIVTHYLSPSQFGKLELLLSISDFATILAGFGLVDALYRFAGLSKTEADEKNIGATIFTLSVVTGIVCFAVGLGLAPFAATVLGDGISLFDLQLLVLLFSVDGCLVIPLAWLKLKENAFTFFILTTGKAICQAIVSWQLLSADFGITAILLGGAISSLILVVILLKIQLGQTGMRLDFTLLPQILLYGTPLVVSALAAYALLSADRWVIALVSTPQELGIYAVGKKLALISFILMQPFCLWWFALRFKQLNTPGGAQSVAHTTSLGIALVLCFSTLVCIGSPMIIDLLIASNYATAMQYLPAMALLFAIKQIAELANLGCYVGKTTWNVMSIDLFTALVSIICLYFLSQIWQVNGVIAALLIAQSLRAVLFYITSQRALYLNYAKGKLAILAVICGVLTFVSLQINVFAQHLLMFLTATAVLTGYLHITGLFSLTPLFKRCSILICVMAATSK
jgi:O-antigen/teichoic acid export membrane protein